MRHLVLLAFLIVASPFSFAAETKKAQTINSIAVLLPKSNITKIVDSKKGKHLLHGQKVKDRFQNCFNLYKEQISVGNCTGFLVKPDIIATAAHCIKDPRSFCAENVVVFDYVGRKQTPFKFHKLPETQNIFYAEKLLSPNKNLFECSQVEYHSINNKIDLAFIRLKNKTNRTPLKLSPFEPRKVGNYRSIGSHLGTPLKVKKKLGLYHPSALNNGQFLLSTLTQRGASGGPIIDSRDNSVRGMITSSTRNRSWEEASGDCIIEDHGLSGVTSVMNSRKILSLLKQIQ